MQNESFMLTTEMLAELLGGNRQYLSKKIRRMMQDPEVRLQAVLKSNKEGYQIPESEVLRCFDRISPAMLRDYKAQVLDMPYRYGVRKLTARKESTPNDQLRKEYISGARTEPEKFSDTQKLNELLIRWRAKLGAMRPEEKSSPETIAYLEEEFQRIETLRLEIVLERAKLDVMLDSCETTARQLQMRIEDLKAENLRSRAVPQPAPETQAATAPAPETQNVSEA